MRTNCKAVLLCTCRCARIRAYCARSHRGVMTMLEHTCQVATASATELIATAAVVAESCHHSRSKHKAVSHARWRSWSIHFKALVTASNCQCQMTWSLSARSQMLCATTLQTRLCESTVICVCRTCSIHEASGGGTQTGSRAMGSPGQAQPGGVPNG